MLTRRTVLATAAAAPALAAFAPAKDADAKFYALLDTLKDEPLDAAAARSGQTTDLLKLRTIDRSALSYEAQIDYDSVIEGLGLEAILRSRFPFGTTGATISPYVVTQRWGTWAQVGGLLKNGPPETLAHYAAALDSETARIASDAASGVVPPATTVAATVTKLAATRDRTAGPLPAALDRQIAALKALPATDIGVCRLKDGDAYYAQALKIGTSLAIDPATAQQVGEQMIADLNAEADAILRRLDLATSTVAERIAALIERGTGRYTADDKGRAQAVADMTATLARVSPAIAPYFDDLPKGAITIGLAPPGRIGYRTAPSYDGTRPGAYYVDLADPVQGNMYRPAWTLPTVVHHETLPGHLLQLPLQEHAAPHPTRLRYTPNAFFEGWAIYAERLAAEIGLLDNDLARLGMLQSLLVRAARLVVDTGIHFRRWSRDEAIARFKAISVFALNPIEDEVDRIIIEPGATCGPALGYLTLMDLRARIRARTTHSDKDFHTTVLKRGALRLSRLDWVVHQELALPP
jgi:uncharacterized protein (DUF885 family)